MEDGRLFLVGDNPDPTASEDSTTLGKLMYPQLSRFLPNNCTIYLKGITKPFGGLRTQINQIIEIKFIAIAR